MSNKNKGLPILHTNIPELDDTIQHASADNLDE
jgi:hypothetical protein